MVNCVTRTAPAKLNMFLHVVGQRADGYHELESLFAFTRRGDKITVRSGEDVSLEIEGPFADALNAVGAKDENLVLKAACALQVRSGTQHGVHIKLVKNLPIASGIGGGSADAAATLLALNEFWNLSLSMAKLEEVALTLGADVPACLYSSPLQVTGIGEVIEKTMLPAAFGVLLVNPGHAVSTPEVFQAFHENQAFHKKKTDYSLRLPQWNPSGVVDFMRWLEQKTSNDLEVPAKALCGIISDVLQALLALDDVQMVRMSGSGATCFALFETAGAAQDAEKLLMQKYPDWWILADQLVAG